MNLQVNVIMNIMQIPWRCYTHNSCSCKKERYLVILVSLHSKYFHRRSGLKLISKYFRVWFVSMSLRPKTWWKRILASWARANPTLTASFASVPRNSKLRPSTIRSIQSGTSSVRSVGTAPFSWYWCSILFYILLKF